MIPEREKEGRIEPQVREALQAFYAQVEALCAIAFPMGMRVAVRQIEPEISMPDMFSRILSGAMGAPKFELRFAHVMLSPGEKPPEGYRWTVYEDHSGVAIGRSA